MNNELAPETEALMQGGFWLPFGITLKTANHQRPITILPNGRHVALQGRIYWLSEFMDDLDAHEFDVLFGVA